MPTLPLSPVETAVDSRHIVSSERADLANLKVVQEVDEVVGVLFAL